MGKSFVIHYINISIRGQYLVQSIQTSFSKFKRLFVTCLPKATSVKDTPGIV